MPKQEFSSPVAPPNDDEGQVAWESREPQTSPIPMQDITIDRLPLGSDGNQWRLYADNDTRDVTPRVKNKDFYTFSVDKQKYELAVQANGTTLDPNVVVDGAKFCVGQYIPFSPVWSPSEPPGIQTKLVKWSFDGNFVNDWILPSDTSSKNYYQDSSLLANETTSAWWVKGGSEAGLGEGLTLDNGQYVAVAANGKFSMYRPSAVMVNPDQNGSPTVIWETPWYSVLGLEHGAIQLGVASVTNNMSYLLRVISSDFSGDAKITQLCNIDASGLDSGCAGCLDGVDPYTDTGVLKNSNPTGNANILNLDDAPDANTNTGTIYMDDSFVDYVMFKPDGDGIYVPLAKVTWDVNASVIYSATDISQTVDGPTGPTDSDEFPQWTNTR